MWFGQQLPSSENRHSPLKRHDMETPPKTGMPLRYSAVFRVYTTVTTLWPEVRRCHEDSITELSSQLLHAPADCVLYTRATLLTLCNKLRTIISRRVKATECWVCLSVGNSICNMLSEIIFHWAYDKPKSDIGSCYNSTIKSPNQGTSPPPSFWCSGLSCGHWQPGIAPARAYEDWLHLLSKICPAGHHFLWSVYLALLIIINLTH